LSSRSALSSQRTMSYIIYARKYRPNTFEEMIGQKAVVQTLQNAVRSDRVAHAYLFSGMRGIGKTTAARILAKALNCKEGPTATPCGVCDFCREIKEDRSVDVLEIDGAANRKVEEARTLLEGLKYQPIYCRYKVIIIDEVHMLTDAAFNTLLKTLEEPPRNTVFILATTEFHKVPATIVSRCQHFEFKKISQKDITNHLLHITKQEKLTISSYGLRLISDAADGSLRDAQSLLDQAVSFSGENINDEDLKELLGTINRRFLYQFSSAIVEEKADVLFELVDKIVESGYDLRFFYGELIEHFRNLMIMKSVSKPDELLVLGEEEIQTLQNEARKVSVEEILRYLVALQQAESGLRYSSQPRIYFETVLVKLSHYKKLVPLEKIIKELDDLKQIKKPERSVKIPSPSRPEMSRQSAPKEPERPRPVSKEPAKTETASKPIPAPVRKAVPAEAPPRKPRKRDEALEDPSVQSFMDKFKAQVLAVEEIKKAKE